MNTLLLRDDDMALGSWNETQLIYTLNCNGMVNNITGRIRQWDSLSAITFHLDTRYKVLMNNNVLGNNQIRATLSSFNVEKIDINDS